MIGVFTAGNAGDSREHAYHGVGEWTEPLRYWQQVADMDLFGLYVFSNGQDWETRVSGLDSKRTDSRGRRLRNSLIARGQCGDRSSEPQGLALARWVLGGEAEGELAERTASVLTQRVVESWYQGETVDLADIDQIVLDSGPIASDGAPAERLWMGLEHGSAPGLAFGAVAELLSGRRGLVAVGEIYPLEYGEHTLSSPRILDELMGDSLVLLVSRQSAEAPRRLEVRGRAGVVTVPKAEPPLATRGQPRTCGVLLALMIVLFLAVILMASH